MLGNKILLHGVESVNYDVNCAFLREVQSFRITLTRSINRFSEVIVGLFK